jgi:hypothetical protein
MSMSKLADRIRRATRVEAAPLGFAAAAARTKSPTMLLGVQVSGDAAKEAAAAFDAGADVVLAAQAGKATPESTDDRVVGVWPAKMAEDAIRDAGETGADFVVIDLDNTPASVLLNDKKGYVLLSPDDIEDMLLRTVESLSVDAILIAGGPGSLTVRRQLELRRIHGLTQKPLLMVVPVSISTQELTALREIGVVGVVVDAAQKGAMDKLGDLKTAISELPPRRRRREDSPMPLLPRAAAVAESHEDEEDE